MTTTKPVELDFNIADVKQKIDSLFDKNKTMSNVVDTRLNNQTVTVTFTNKNPDGSSKTSSAEFTTPQAAQFAKKDLDRKLATHKAQDRSFEDVTPIKTKPAVPSGQFAVNL